MPNRRRYATREELEKILAGRTEGIDWPAALQVLEDLGAPVDQLVKVVSEEEV